MSQHSKSPPKKSSLSSLARASKGTLLAKGSLNDKRIGFAKHKRISHSYEIGATRTDEKKSTDTEPTATFQTAGSNFQILDSNSSSMELDTTDVVQLSVTTKPTSYVIGGEKTFAEKTYDSSTTRQTATTFEIPATPLAQLPTTLNGTGENHQHCHDGMELDREELQPSTGTNSSSFVIGNETQLPPHYNHQQNGDSNNNNNGYYDDGEIEKMEGVIDLSEKPPMVVLDGANVAYAYDKAWNGIESSLANSQRRPQPDVRGIVVACQYFLKAGIRVLAVVPSTILHRDPHQKHLKALEQQGLLVPAPSRDDDDAYAITIARREDIKSQQRGDGPGYTMSNDMFRDACQREEAEDAQSTLRQWLNEGTTRDNGKTGPGRISYTFCYTGSMDDHGDKVLDIVPNPRHPLIQFIEKQAHH